MRSGGCAVLSGVLFDENCLDEAEEAAQKALRLRPVKSNSVSRQERLLRSERLSVIRGALRHIQTMDVLYSANSRFAD